MRRIYESRALAYDDDDPYAPKQTDDGSESSRRVVDWEAASHALVPVPLRRRAIDVSLATERDTYAPGETVHFEASFHNRLPLPIVLRTASPVRWTWRVDGLNEASHVVEYPPETSLFSFARGERKTFGRRWRQRFQRAPGSWELAEPGEYALSVRVNTPEGETTALSAETTITIE